MKLIMLVTMILALTATATSSATVVPGKPAAIVALRQAMAPAKIGPVACRDFFNNPLTWSCTFQLGKAQVLFNRLHSGTVKTGVFVVCSRTGTTAASGCR